MLSYVDVGVEQVTTVGIHVWEPVRRLTHCFRAISYHVVMHTVIQTTCVPHIRRLKAERNLGLHFLAITTIINRYMDVSVMYVC